VPHDEALVAPDGTFTYAELDQRADEVAAGLAARGVRKGDRVALVLPNSAEAAVAIYGVLRAGAAISPVDPSIKPERLAYMLTDSGAALALCDARASGVVGDAAAAAGTEVVTGLESLGDGKPLSQVPADLDLASIIYTSGSTGEPKGVTLTHRNIAFAADSIIEYLALGGEDRVLSVLPLSFGYGLSQLLTCVRVGAALVLEQGLAFPGRIVQQLEEQRVTGLPGVPTVFAVLTGLKGLAERELPDLRFLTNAGAALPVAMVRTLRETFPGARLFSMYGQTECMRISYLPPELIDQKPQSVGIAIPGTEVWIEDEDGEVLEPGRVGELIVRGTHVMQGYWGKTALSAERLREGRWAGERVLATGDLFRRDEDGHLYFVGRRDDIFKSRGEKVAPREVEQVLEGITGVGVAAVVGRPDALLGHAVHAHVVGESGAELDAEALKRHCAEHLEAYKVPQQVTVHEALPRTPNGKIDKAALKGSEPPAA
jgi:amino acid adenylation domain-containing protein